MYLQIIMCMGIIAHSCAAMTMPPKGKASMLTKIRNHTNKTYWWDNRTKTVYLHEPQYKEKRIRIDDEFNTIIHEAKPGRLYPICKGERGALLYDPATYTEQDVDKTYDTLNYSAAAARLSPPTQRYHYPGSLPRLTPTRKTPPRSTTPQSESSSPAIFNTVHPQERDSATPQRLIEFTPVVAPPAGPAKNYRQKVPLIAALTLIGIRLHQQRTLIRDTIKDPYMTEDQRAACWFFDRWLVACAVRIGSLLPRCIASLVSL